MFGNNKPPKQPLDVDAEKSQRSINIDVLREKCKALKAEAQQSVEKGRQAISRIEESREKELAAARFRLAATNQGLTANTATQQQAVNSAPAKKTPTK